MKRFRWSRKVRSIDGCFTADYFQARARFLEACNKRNLEVSAHVHPRSQGGKQELATDAVFIGRPAAKKMLVITSGFHGVELLCGSGCQTRLIESGCLSALPGDLSILQIHAVNPWGAAFLRRNNEDNVDLCRNFLDHAAACPANEEYDKLHGALCCPTLTGAEREEADGVLEAYKRRHGPRAFVDAIMSGQYKHPEGMSYGGAKAAWSRQTVVEILGHHARDARQVCLIDIHSGFGPYGYGSVFCFEEGEGLTRARDWFGGWLVAPMEQAEPSNRSSHPALGHPARAYQKMLQKAETTSIVLEVGTYDLENNLRVLLDDHWLEFNGKGQDEAAADIKSNLLEAHCPDDPEWRDAAWAGCERVVRQALRGLRQ